MRIFKKFFICALSLSLIFASGNFRVSAGNDTKAVNLLGVINNAKGASLEGKSKITRAQFARMVVTLSKNDKMLKKLSKKKLFRDVKKKSKYQPYINVVGMKGYMRGFSNRKFAPNQKVTMSMAAYSSLKMLGYDDKELMSMGIDGILEKFNSLQLAKNINKQPSDYLSGRDCANLFTNLLYAAKKDGNIYGKTLGYNFNADGSIDVYSMISAGNRIMLAKSSNLASMGIFADKVYRDDKPSNASSIEKLDLIYYNKDTSTVNAYSEKVYGQLSEIQPAMSNAKNVVIGGKTYELAASPINTPDNSMAGMSEWSSSLRSQGIEIGSYVIGIKDPSGKIVAIVKQGANNEKLVGYVIKNETKKVSNGKDGFTIANVMTIVTSSNVEVEVVSSEVAIGEGNIVSVEYDALGKPVIKVLNNSGGNLNGKQAMISSSVRAVEISGVAHASILPGTLKAVDLSNINAAYIAYNNNGEISELILRNSIGAALTYGLVTDIQGDMITFLNKGTPQSATYTSLGGYDVSKSVIACSIKDGAIVNIQPVREVSLQSINGNIAYTANGQYVIDDGVDVYYKALGKWKHDSLKDMNNISGHVVKGYYTGDSNIIKLIVIER